MGVLLLNLGGPDALSAVRPFLYNLFSDRDIIRLGPAFLQKPLACLIAALRAGKTRAAYARIGGKSPIREITLNQASALERELNSLTSDAQSSTFRVFVGMRYWHPLFEDVIKEIHIQGIEKLMVLSLYPHYSVATTGSSLSYLKNVLASYPAIKTCEITSWYDHPLYIDALVESINRGLASFSSSLGPPQGWNSERDVHILFSAHSLPKKFVDEGDPYVDHIMATVRAVTARISNPWKLSYQSKSGPVAWLEPSTEQMLEDMASRGVKNLLVVPISFVSDHIETLYEIDMLYKDMAAGLGMRLERAESLNLSPAFIAALRAIVVQGMKEATWSE
ncbi:MAG: ferrochelatase [Nitrospirae bacterium]|nr:ferrochelatase [Nitrospirota bacterium]